MATNNKAEWKEVQKYDVINQHVTYRVVVIEDIGHEYTASVTTDAERVVRDLYDFYGDRRFVYKDSEGNYDELLHKNGRFTGFRRYKTASE
tara:strand:+ start:2124 stop:2396 length:273 start_codon:yes stop_codon:yes gene_type:complete